MATFASTMKPLLTVFIAISLQASAQTDTMLLNARTNSYVPTGKRGVIYVDSEEWSALRVSPDGQYEVIGDTMQVMRQLYERIMRLEQSNRSLRDDYNALVDKVNARSAAARAALSSILRESKREFKPIEVTTRERLMLHPIEGMMVTQTDGLFRGTWVVVNGTWKYVRQ